MRINLNVAQRPQMLLLYAIQLVESVVYLASLGFIQMSLYDRILFSDWIQGE